MLDDSITSVELAHIGDVTHSATNSTFSFDIDLCVISPLDCFCELRLQSVDKFTLIRSEGTFDNKRTLIVLLFFCHQNIDVLT